MTVLPEPPGHLLTITEYAALGETDPGYTELLEGRLLRSLSPSMRHMIASGRLFQQLSKQLPADVCAIQDVDIDLRLTGTDEPGWSRRPDLVVVSQAAVDRVDNEGGLLASHEMMLVVEIVSPGSRRMDHVIKRGEYADAGIGHYWIVDLDPPVSLLACHLAGDFGYADDGMITGIHTTEFPIPSTINLNKLRWSEFQATYIRHYS